MVKFSSSKRISVLVHVKYSGESEHTFHNLFIFRSNELLTTLTLLIAIAPQAIIGLKSHPVKGYKIPAAIGIPRTL